MLNLVMRTEGKGSGPVYIGDGPGLIKLEVHSLWRHKELKDYAKQNKAAKTGEGSHDNALFFNDVAGGCTGEIVPVFNTPHVVFKCTQASMDKTGTAVTYVPVRQGSMATLFGAKGDWTDDKDWLSSTVDITVIDLQSYRAVSLGFECDREVPIDRDVVRINKIKTGNCNFPASLRPQSEAAK